MPSDSAWSAAHGACERAWVALVRDGCDPDVALDRVWDCMLCASGHREGHCFDSRDRAVEDEIRDILEKGTKQCQGR